MALVGGAASFALLLLFFSSPWACWGFLAALLGLELVEVGRARASEEPFLQWLRANLGRSLWIPVLLAVAIALACAPAVARTLDLGQWPQDSVKDLWAPGGREAWIAAIGAAVISAPITAVLTAPLARRHFLMGAVLTFLVALVISVAVFPLVPALAGEHGGAALFCLDSCSAAVNTDALANYLAVGFFALAPWVEPGPVLTLAIGTTVWAGLVHQLGHGSEQSVG